MAEPHTQGQEDRGDAPARPRVLFVGSGPLWRPEAGYLVRQRVFLEAFERFADVTLALFGLEDESIPEGWAEKVVVLPTPARRGGSRLGRLWADMTSSTPRTARSRDVGASRAAVGALSPDAFDGVFAYRVDFAGWAGVLGRPGLVLDIDDPEALRVRRQFEATGEAIDGRTRRDLDKLLAYEQSAVSSAAAAFVCQQGDRDALGVPGVGVVANVVVRPAAPPQRHAGSKALVFIGNLSAGARTPNGDGLLWFVQEVLPKVLEQEPDARLRVAGKLHPDVSARLDGRAGVEVLGFVDDLGAVIDSSAASVVPIRYGTGTRIKVLDAMARACPVVSTAMGCDGIASGARSGVVVADEPVGFASACVRMLRDPEECRRVGLAGYALVGREYDRAALVASLAHKLEQTITGQARGVAG